MTTGRGPQLTIGELTANDATHQAMVQLVAARQTDMAGLLPGVSTRFCVGEEAASVVPPPCAGDLGAWRDDRLVAFLAGRIDGGFGFVPTSHHAVDRSEADPTSVYGSLYSELAQRWLALGVTVHDVELPAVPATEHAWFDLGFGRRTCFAVRAVRDNVPEPRGTVEVRVGDNSDLPSIARLAVIEADFRRAAPLFAQQATADPEEFEAQHRQLMQDGSVHLIARSEGVDAGLLTIGPISPSPLLTADRAPFIGPTAVDPTVRGLGIGRQLVDAAVRWAAAHDHPWLAVSFNTPNLASRPFWLGNDFVPTGWKLARRLPATLPA